MDLKAPYIKTDINGFVKSLDFHDCGQSIAVKVENKEILIMDVDSLVSIYLQKNVFKSDKSGYTEVRMNCDFMLCKKNGEGWSELVNLSKSNLIKGVKNILCPFYSKDGGQVLASYESKKFLQVNYAIITRNTQRQIVEQQGIACIVDIMTGVCIELLT